MLTQVIGHEFGFPESNLSLSSGGAQQMGKNDKKIYEGRELDVIQCLNYKQIVEKI